MHIRLLLLFLLLSPTSGQEAQPAAALTLTSLNASAHSLPQIQDGDLPQGDLRLLPRELELKNLPPLSEGDKIRWVLRTSPFSPLH